MRLLKVPYLPGIHYGGSVPDLADLFLDGEPNKLTYEPWQSGGDKPEVMFFIAYGDDALYLKFAVKEKHFRANYRQTNDPIYKDSCVEFFIGFDDTAYYNFEFNALGTAYVAYGLPDNRVQLPVTLVSEIERRAVNKTVFTDHLPFQWELTLAIPFTLFYKHSISTLKGMVCKANFYKCGDDLPEPHFLSWNNIIADKPNFHLPEYFGSVIFE